MHPYPESYLDEVVENQGSLFDLVANSYPDKDTRDFIIAFMSGKTRKYMDQGQAYVNTMDEERLWDFFTTTDHYTLKSGPALKGFMPEWIGEFYAYYQWYYNVPSAEVIKRVPVDFLMKAYHGLHDLDLELAVKKVGENQ